MMIPVKLREIEVYHGAHVVPNEFYIEHFKQKGKDIEHFLTDIIGRKQRYMIDPALENNLTMAVEVSKRILEKAGLSGADIDMIVYSSMAPEYLMPPCSIHLHEAINGKAECVCYDTNVNCAGMTVTLEQMSKYMALSPNIHRAMLVGCDYVNFYLDPNNELSYGHYGDAACAIILERTDEDCGVLGAKYHMNSVEHTNILFPSCGLSKLFTEPNRDALRLEWKPFENVSPPIAVANMNALLAENGLTKEDVAAFCLSQYALISVRTIRELMGIDEAHSLFIGDEYGYTGTSSPFIVLYEAVKRGLVHRGDYVMFWTIGAGSENIALLFRY